MQTVPSVVAEATYMGAKLVSRSEQTNLESLGSPVWTRHELHRPSWGILIGSRG